MNKPKLIFQPQLSEAWHNIDNSKILELLNTSKNGLTNEEAIEKLKIFGTNEISSKNKISPLKLFFEQFSSLLTVILIIAAIISYLIGEHVEAYAIIIIVLLAGILGFFQEFQANKALDALKKMASPRAKLFRNNNEEIINSSELVPGDVVLVETGDTIPADCRIINSFNLKVVESSFTGESLPVEKHSEVIENINIPVGDKKNMLFMGTSVSFGRARAVVVNTGMSTEFGKIAGMLEDSEKRETPLQQNLNVLGKKIGVFSIVLALFMSVVGLFRGYELAEMFVWGVSLAVAVIPEALPAVVTISIALGVRRMVKRKALIKKLPAVETLGSTNVICTDKTGTLTKDEMTVKKVYKGGKVYNVTGLGYDPIGDIIDSNNEILKYGMDKELDILMNIGALCNDTVLDNENGKWRIIGDPTEGALIALAEKYGINSESFKIQNKRIYEIPFSSEMKRMTTVNSIDDKLFAFSKGAPEVILNHCSSITLNGEITQLTNELKEKVLSETSKFADEALRVLGLAYNPLPDDIKLTDEVENNLIFIGFVGMIDPPREEVKDSIQIAENAGIKSIMITGDHIKTAIAVAKELKILSPGKKAIEGWQLEEMSDEELDNECENIEVYARISPAHKLRIVKTLMNKGYIVTMTGDGVNDAPALKNADIGVAMGIKGTDVSREAADMILTNDNFSSIVAAIEEGRSIFENIRKYLVYLLSGNLGTIIAMMVSLLANYPLPLMAVQVLFINFLMDGLIAIALSVEPAEPGIMNKKPRNVKLGILNRSTLIYTIGSGTWIGLITTSIFIWTVENGYSNSESVTIFFVSLILARIFNGFVCRSFERPIYKMKFFGNVPLLLNSLVSLLATILVVNSEILQAPFHTVSISLSHWLIISLITSSTILFVMFSKWIRNSFLKGFFEKMEH